MAFPICWSIWPSKARRGAPRSEIAEEIEQVGGDLNAATSLELTAYYVRVLEGDRCAGAWIFWPTS